MRQHMGFLSFFWKYGGAPKTTEKAQNAFVVILLNSYIASGAYMNLLMSGTLGAVLLLISGGVRAEYRRELATNAPCRGGSVRLWRPHGV